MTVIIDGTAGITFPVVAGGTSAVQASSGKVLQVVSTTKQDTFSMSGSSFVAITGLTASITPTSSSSKILIMLTIGRVGPNASGVGSTAAFQLLRGSTAIGIGTASGSLYGSSFVTTAIANNNYVSGGFSTQYLDSPSTTSSTTYGVQVIAESNGTLYINRNWTDGDANTTYGSRSISTITVMEIAA
jgi:hypothetical protein